jgi:hypothetical protein
MITLSAAVAAAAAELPGVIRREHAETIEYELNDRPIAILEVVADEVSFRLSPAVAAAAIRTPDTEPSPRGPEWVALRPAVVDDHALDRAVAWLESAWRNAGG